METNTSPTDLTPLFMDEVTRRLAADGLFDGLSEQAVYHPSTVGTAEWLRRMGETPAAYDPTTDPNHVLYRSPGRQPGGALDPGLLVNPASWAPLPQSRGDRFAREYLGIPLPAYPTWREYDDHLQWTSRDAEPLRFRHDGVGYRRHAPHAVQMEIFWEQGPGRPSAWQASTTFRGQRMTSGVVPGVEGRAHPSEARARALIRLCEEAGRAIAHKILATEDPRVFDPHWIPPSATQMNGGAVQEHTRP